MNFSPSAQTSFDDPRLLERYIAEAFGEQEIYKSKLRWLDAHIRDLQQQLKQLNQE